VSIAPDDPRLTAYALGELDPEALQAFRAELAEDPRARAELSALRELGARLERELRSEPVPALSAAQREAILAAVRAPELRRRAAATGPNHGPLATAPGASPTPAPGSVAPERRLIASATPPLRWRHVGLWMAAIVSMLGASVWLLNWQQADEQPVVASASTETSAQAYEVTGILRRPTPSGLREAVEFGQMREPDDHEVAGAPSVPPTPEAAAAPVANLWGDAIGEAYGSGHGRLASKPSAATVDPRMQRLSEKTVRRAEAVFNDEQGAGAPPGQLAALGNREAYDAVGDNPFLRVATEPRSTFSIDVDTASYALVRRFLSSGSLPPRGAVRIEELLNYFSYRYPEPSGDEPFSVVANLAQAPWAPEHQLVRIGLQARHVAQGARPPANLVFLIDVSGSMNAPNKLELVKYGLRRLTESLGARDRVAIVVYAGASGLVLPATAGSRKSEIQQALAQLEAGGSTNGGQGIELAYSLATQNFIRGGVNRVLLATDGDFNVGVTNQSDLVELIQRKAKTGVFLSVLGFGAGNYQDSMLEKLADKGNGNYAYVDEPAEAEKVLVEQASGTLVTVAKDVKLQLEFNPAEVAAFRLLGYENRLLQHQDFNDDSKDAGEVGAGHSVTALYEIIPVGGTVPSADVDPLKYQTPAAAPASPPLGTAQTQGEWLNIKLRYQPPEGGASRLKELALRGPVNAMNEDFRFAAALAEFGMLLRGSPHRGQASYEQVLQLAQGALGDGKDRQAREQFVELVRSARRLAGAEGPAGKPRPYDPLNGSLP